MITVRQLLSRIRWDPEFGLGEFVIGYYDRLEGEVILVPLGEIRFPDADRFSFQLLDPYGEPISIPLHRICRVYRDGELIWQRNIFDRQRGANS